MLKFFGLLGYFYTIIVCFPCSNTVSEISILPKSVSDISKEWSNFLILFRFYLLLTPCHHWSFIHCYNFGYRGVPHLFLTLAHICVVDLDVSGIALCIHRIPTSRPYNNPFLLVPKRFSDFAKSCTILFSVRLNLSRFAFRKVVSVNLLGIYCSCWQNAFRTP